MRRDGRTCLNGLSNVGEAVGYDFDTDGLAQRFVVTTSTVPEPSTTASMALALVVPAARLAPRRPNA